MSLLDKWFFVVCLLLKIVLLLISRGMNRFHYWTFCFVSLLSISTGIDLQLLDIVSHVFRGLKQMEASHCGTLASLCFVRLPEAWPFIFTSFGASQAYVSSKRKPEGWAVL